ncbi:hypothetical protein HBN50_01820 [Halobacteriovorax sp. GB3]|uniref:hypothetical protein n=1 Tax=Halobacteriovorax sp. GB3 TaxID=2719615 RepID=UPI00235EC1A0|nr:hypothetical protein [Halobacteriovorax sp. GB3]MDD0851808.1 hypothetical protein [Halobacteriovorax sp. GB3]
MKKNFDDLESWAPKKLRTLRNNLNNRIQSYKNNPSNPKVLSESHMLYGLEQDECEQLLKKVKILILKAK